MDSMKVTTEGDRADILFPEDQRLYKPFQPPVSNAVSTDANNRGTGFYYSHITLSDKSRWSSKANYALLSKQTTKQDSVNMKQKHKQSDQDYEDLWSKESKPQPPAKISNNLNIYEDPMELNGHPPVITDGRSTHKSGAKAVVRPIAFKPVTPSRQSDHSPDVYTPISYDDGYSSHEVTRYSSHSGSTMSRESDIYASPAHLKVEESDRQAGHEGVISLAEYETLISEKDAEMTKLREVMELNEQAIIRVQEKRRRDWESQMKDLTQEYHRRLRLQQNDARTTEDNLRMTINRLECENQRLVHETRQNQEHVYRNNELSEEIRKLQIKNGELSQQLTQASCENELLRNKTIDLEQQNENLEIQLTSGQVEQRKLENHLVDTERKLTNSEHNSNNKLERLKYELSLREQQIQADKEAFNKEREQWHQEKVKVLQYQKQLQQTYVQMYRRNIELERQLCRINSRRTSGRDSVSSYNHQDRHSYMSVELESNPESFC